MQKSIKLLAGILILVILTSGIIGMTVLAVSNSNGTDEDLTISSREDKRSNGNKSGVRVNEISIAASVLDMTKEEVKEFIKDAKIGDLLIAANKVDEFKTVYLSELIIKLDAAVAAGSLTHEQADEKYEAGKTKMDEYDGTTHLCGGTCHGGVFGAFSYNQQRRSR